MDKDPVVALDPTEKGSKPKIKFVKNEEESSRPPSRGKDESASKESGE